MDVITVKIRKPTEINFVLGQSPFIKSVEDIHEAVASSMPGIAFGLAFCEASGDCLIRVSGNDTEMMELATMNAEAIGAGHSFILFVKNAFPIVFLNAVKNVPEVCRIFCATANETEVVIGDSKQGRGILGVIDGERPKGVENDESKQARHDLLRKFGYKL